MTQGRVERVFMDWDGPGLRKAVDWLESRYANDETWDLSGVLIVTPAGRAGRRLLEILVGRAAGRVLRPPRGVVTIGALPERLYQASLPVADELVCLLARAAALRDTEPKRLRLLITHPPKKDDMPGWIALAKDLEKVSTDLASELLSPLDVPGKCPDLAGSERWGVIGDIHRRYESLLAERGTVDLHQARRFAVESGACVAACDIVLLATSDLSGVIRAMLRSVMRRSDEHQIVALIHGPQSISGGFDELGGLVTSWWQDHFLELAPDQIRIVDRPADQAREALAQIVWAASDAAAKRAAGNDGPAKDSGDAEGGPVVDPNEVTVGLGDETMSPLVERTLELSGLEARSGMGRNLALTPPVVLLAAMARFLQRKRLDEFAALIRHPDLQRYLSDVVIAPGLLAPILESADWLTLLDAYITDHIQTSVAEGWISDGSDSASAKQAYDLIMAILPRNHDKAQPLPAWSQAIADLLGKVYQGRTLGRDDPEESQLIASLSAIAEALKEQARLDPLDSITPRVSLADALHLTVGRIEGNVPGIVRGPAVELLGWLELQLDDAPTLIVTGMNEGMVPQSVNSDAYLPDSARNAVGILDNARRYARDLYALTAITRSRPTVRLICGRRGGDDSPLAPSRLLLACPPKPDDLLARRVLAFYDHAGQPPSSSAIYTSTSLPAPGAFSRFAMPLPSPVESPINKLTVTAFKQYLACPYRFYLQFVRRLRAVDDEAVELDPMAFGNLAHAVLEDFGHSELTTVVSEGPIIEYLSKQLNEHAAKMFGMSPPAAVTLQLEQLRGRLNAFSAWQARSTKEGWRIQRTKIEKEYQASITVDGSAFNIYGKIDRIDRHPEQGWRILDYKTGDKALKPNETHRAKVDGQEQWIDLQLPLYHLLAQEAGATGRIRLGYVNLPKTLADVEGQMADWSDQEIASAVEVARGVIRNVRAQNFWPPAEQPTFADDFSGICMDACVDRNDAIRRQSKGVA